MRVLVIRYHEEDSPGFIGDALERRGAQLSSIVTPDEGPLPPVSDFDAVVVLGAKWSVYDEGTVGSWLKEQLKWVREASDAGVPVLGICFGAQVLSAAFGGSVEPAPAPEIGWRTIEVLDGSGVPAGPWLEFHNDRCVLPPEAVLLASNDVGPQAFFIGRNLGVQFHPEVDGEQLTAWYDDGGRQFVVDAGGDPDVLLAETVREEPGSRDRAEQIVALFLERGVG